MVHVTNLTPGSDLNPALETPVEDCQYGPRSSQYGTRNQSDSPGSGGDPTRRPARARRRRGGAVVRRAHEVRAGDAQGHVAGVPPRRRAQHGVPRRRPRRRAGLQVGLARFTLCVCVWNNIFSVCVCVWKIFSAIRYSMETEQTVTVNQTSRTLFCSQTPINDSQYVPCDDSQYGSCDDSQYVGLCNPSDTRECQPYLRVRAQRGGALQVESSLPIAHSL
jgi:hypothetical protein